MLLHIVWLLDVSSRTEISDFFSKINHLLRQQLISAVYLYYPPYISPHRGFPKPILLTSPVQYRVCLVNKLSLLSSCLSSKPTMLFIMDSEKPYQSSSQLMCLWSSSICAYEDSKERHILSSLFLQMLLWPGFRIWGGGGRFWYFPSLLVAAQSLNYTFKHSVIFVINMMVTEGRGSLLYANCKL